MATMGGRQQGGSPLKPRPMAATEAGGSRAVPAALPSSAVLLTGPRTGLSNILAPLRSPLRGSDSYAGSGASSPTLAPGSPTTSSSTRGARGQVEGIAEQTAATHTTTTVRPQASPARTRPVSSSFDFGRPGAGGVLQRTPNLSGTGAAVGRPPLARAAGQGVGRGPPVGAGGSATTAPRSAPSSPLRGAAPTLPTTSGRMAANPVPHTRYAAPPIKPVVSASTDGAMLRMPRNLWEDTHLSAAGPALGASIGPGLLLEEAVGSSTIAPTLRAWDVENIQRSSSTATDEERAVGLHRVRSSIQRLEVATQEAAARSRSPSPSSSKASPSLAGSAIAGGVHTWAH
jgi:hypothetical protein